MIRYTLVCPDRHEFEVWFSGSEAFETQQSEGLLSCPVCGSSDVERGLMAPAVATARRREGRLGQPGGQANATDEDVPAGESNENRQAVQLAANVPERQEFVAAVRRLREHLTANAEDVGTRFAEEARKIHYNETEKRGIYGQATPDDARALADEGIEFHPLPPLPEDHN